MVQGYLKEIEELRAKLLESEATCQQLRKSSMRPRGSISHGNPFDMFGGETSNVTSLIEEAKRELAKEVDRLSQSNYRDQTGEEKKNGVAEDEGSQADIEKENEMQQQYGLKLAELNSEMNIKQKLIEELEQSQRRLQTMRQHYEDKVKLMNKIKEESQRHKQLEMQRNREIAQLRKETRKHENQIRSLEQDKKIRDAMIRRKNEEVTALRRVNRGNLSNKAAGRVSRNVSRNMGFLPRVAKQKWQKQLQERERLGRARDDLLDKISEASKKQYGDDTIKDLSDQLEVTNANIEYIQYVIKESQQTIVEVEDSKENSDSTEIDEVVQNIMDIEEAKYLITKLYNMSINQTYEVALRESNIKETEAELRELKQQNNIQQHVNKNNIQTKLQKEKIRGRKTRGGCELLSFLYGDQGAPEDGPSVTLDSGETPDLLQPPSRPINRVPSAPGSLKTMTLPKPDPIKPSPAMSRKVAAKAPLICTHVAEGHSRAVLSVDATDDLLFSSSKVLLGCHLLDQSPLLRLLIHCISLLGSHN
ncbi:Kinesin-like protein KIF21B [Gryllus bimaculatus]|nr:Kinesin-like protein KIF21B [Gryllus bimaculatus]